MVEFINTSFVIGDDALVDSIIMRTVTEYKENRITTVERLAFYGCTELVEVDLPNVMKVARGGFRNCTSLKSVNIPNANVIERETFIGCASLTEIYLPKLTDIASESASGTGLFAACTNLKKADFTELSSVGGRAFYDCTSLTALLLRKTDAICTLASTNAFGQTPIASGTGYIYVPRALLSDTDETKDYRRATNWSTYAAQFRAIEDYTVDGTVTGELDETKIAA